MTFDIALTLFLVFGAVVALTFTRLSPDVVLMSALTGLLLGGIFEHNSEAFVGFGNTGVITVAALYIVAEGVRQTGAVTTLLQKVLGEPRTATGAQARVLIPAAAFSAFLNNTPVVAMYLPVLADWAKRLKLSVSHLYLPLSYATILGGLCTTIGTSTTVVVNDQLAAVDGQRAIGFLEIAYVGLPCAIVGLSFLLLTSNWLLPVRKPAVSQFDNPREYTIEMIVEPFSQLIGKTIQKAGLRSLPNLFLMEIERRGNMLVAVGPDEPLEANDRLVFAGAVSSLVDLQKIPGLSPATSQVHKLDEPRLVRSLLEAVVSNTAPIANQTIRESKFRTRYKAAVIAVARNGERLPGKIGDIRLRAGDTLLIEAPSSFYDLHKDSQDFFLVSQVDDSAPPRHERGLVARLIVLAMVASFATSDTTGISQVASAIVAAGLMLATRCVRANEARKAIDLNVLITMAAGIGLGHAMTSSGADELIAESLVGSIALGPLAGLATVSAVTFCLTNLITAKAAAVLMLPIALSTAATLGCEGTPFAIAVMVSGASSFATPIGYQTNLMVYGPGGYRASDFLRLGIPLSIIVWAVSLATIPFVWPLSK